jgi:hypothetical protein
MMSVHIESRTLTSLAKDRARGKQRGDFNGSNSGNFRGDAEA